MATTTQQPVITTTRKWSVWCSQTAAAHDIATVARHLIHWHRHRRHWHYIRRRSVAAACQHGCATRVCVLDMCAGGLKRIYVPNLFDDRCLGRLPVEDIAQALYEPHHATSYCPAVYFAMRPSSFDAPAQAHQLIQQWKKDAWNAQEGRRDKG
eukprot:358196-Pyramimonas_sp.AAC.1